MRLPPRIRTLYATELRTLLRDRRTILIAIVLPLVVTPLMLGISRRVEQQRRAELATREYRFAVTGPRAAEARPLVEEAASASRRDPPATRARFRAASADDPAQALAGRRLDFYVDAVSAPAPDAKTRLDTGDEGSTPEGLLTLALVYRGDRDDSRAGAEALRARLRDLRQERRFALARFAGLPGSAEAVLPLSATSIAAAGQMAGLTLGRYATVMLMFFMLAGAAVVAQDTLAGEKERGTLETLLTTAASRVEIVTAKFLLVLTVCMVITVIQVGNLLAYVGFGLIPTSGNLAAAITPAVALGLFVLLVPVAALVSGVLLLVSGHAKTYREAQLYFMPLMLAGAMPALAATLPSITLRSIVALVPIANISVGVKEVLVGRVDWPMLAVAWTVTAGAALVAIRHAARALSTERLIVPSLDESAADAAGVRPGQVLTFFAVMWGLLLLVSLNLGTTFDIRGQLAINLVVMFLGGSLWFVHRHRLDYRQAFALRPVPWPVWVAVVAGIPSGVLTGIGVFRLASLAVPVPREVLEGFGQYLAPDTIPLWQLLPLMTILPGICEELAFRGLLLQTLRRRLSAPAAVLTVGAVFALFHFSLFRLFPTAYLGMILATVTLLTGSIFPAMLWHAGNNGVALLAGKWGISMAGLDAPLYAAGAAVLALSFWILWRSRKMRISLPM